MTDAEALRLRHARLLARLRGIAAEHGRDADRLRIVAVTKTWPVEVVQAARDAGIEALGENRVQEAEPKIAAVPDVEWHLVGRLQGNKARRAIAAFAWIHSVDSGELLKRLTRLAADEGRNVRLLLQVNVTGEASKGGFAPEDLDGLTSPVRDAPVVGLMTIARQGASVDEARTTFRRLRGLRDRLAEGAGVELPELSMGMSDDAEAAVAEGATLVRIGTAIFGTRG